MTYNKISFHYYYMPRRGRESLETEKIKPEHWISSFSDYGDRESSSYWSAKPIYSIPQKRNTEPPFVC